MQERIGMLESQLQYQTKENEDLKHDNTILYQKNVQNKERLDKVQVEIEDLKQYVDSEKQKNAHLDNEAHRLMTKIQHQEEMIRVEKERVAAKDRAIEELAHQRQIVEQEH